MSTERDGAQLRRGVEIMTRLRLRLLLAALALVLPGAAAAQPTDEVRYYHLDAIGSVRMVTDANGDILAYHDYTPFGQQWQAPMFSNLRRFAGKEFDAETEYDYFGGRFYRSASGRFTTADPQLGIETALADPQRWNRYSYVSNRPLRKVDPDGRYEIDVHYHLTRVLALAAGFRAEAAIAIANADQLTDTNPVTEPFRDFDARKNFHFTTPDRRREMWQSALDNRSLGMLGVFLHAQQDSFSHRDFGPGQGHLLFGHAPDKTYNDVERANVMAGDSYTRLVAAMYKIQGSGRSSTGSTPNETFSGSLRFWTSWLRLSIPTDSAAC
jgi:RHS repeat-associated protein